MLSIASSNCWRRVSDRCTLATVDHFDPENTVWEVPSGCYLRDGGHRPGTCDIYGNPASLD
jgi:hypothetical protein